MSDEKIRTPCPACGANTLFIGSGGHLTCSVIGCKEPGVERAVNGLKRQLRIACAEKRVAVARIAHAASERELQEALYAESVVVAAHD